MQADLPSPRPDAHYFLSHYKAEDYQLLQGWRSERGLPSPHESAVPKTSLVCFRQDDLTHEPRPMGFISLYLDGSCGVGHVDWLTTRLGLTPNEAHVVAGHLLAGVAHMAQLSFPGPCLLLGCVQSEAMANAVRKHGFIPTEQVTLILKELEPWEHHLQSFHSSPPS